MERFTRLTGVAAPIEGADIDTDQILPARFMHKRRVDYGQYCFHDQRLDTTGRPRPDFVLNRPGFQESAILVGDRNFGCGSSREQAVHTLADFGIRSVIAVSFGDIFQTNCLKNGLLPVTLPEEVVRVLRENLTAAPGQLLTVDLETEQVVEADGTAHAFSTDPFGRSCLLAGLDEIDYTLSLLDRVSAFEAAGQ
ncbi:3-isopropylmalate dehydratase small subunit [Bosea sp. (in: a-proteobacteria)]|jgi:3-isopropylmalate/(R)-2-methylmalate dehydratase small subunit|uniref:3-isopropylmalate dehydratase small subunit n=1 Tax=Bosea sp. (in: a-proteobacteria) TaxID=1871050 RepID=UPI002DDCF739|nr:3-isopropylmalate dehydratase small subunit [Bosea sp. (in: a-proteobacteria)]HEV2508402.1 3-isopropylmalate dehydratase small subunit [Bosea sp. (in: a-proteobacteria)]